MPKTDLDALVAKWAPRLGLGTWDIKAAFAPGYKLKAEAGADVVIWWAHEKAFIRVMDPGEWQARGFGWAQDPEHEIVHELLHVALGHFTDGPTGKTEEEQFINRMARAFLALDRGGDGGR